MNHAVELAVYVSPLEQFRYFLAHQPAVLSLVLAYALGCALFYWVTRGRGFLVAMVSGAFYLCPKVMRLASV